FPGDRPSTLIGIDELSPEALGALIAFYEHRTFVQGVLADVNSFDQWGVELGKEMANQLAPALESGTAPHGLHASTAAWIARLRRCPPRGSSPLQADEKRKIDERKEERRDDRTPEAERKGLTAKHRAIGGRNNRFRQRAEQIENVGGAHHHQE